MIIGDQTSNAAALPQFQASDIEWNMYDFFQSQYSLGDANAQRSGPLNQPLLNNWDSALAATNSHLNNADMTVDDQSFNPAALPQFQASNIEGRMADFLQSQYSLENANAQHFGPFAANTFEASSESWSTPSLMTDDGHGPFEAQSHAWDGSIHQDMQPPFQPLNAYSLAQSFEGMVDLADDSAQTHENVFQDASHALRSNGKQAAKASDSIMNTPANTNEPAQEVGEIAPAANTSMSARLSLSAPNPSNLGRFRQTACVHISYYQLTTNMSVSVCVRRLWRSHPPPIWPG